MSIIKIESKIWGQFYCLQCISGSVIISSLAALWIFLSPEQAVKEAWEDYIGLRSVWNPPSTLTLSCY